MAMVAAKRRCGCLVSESIPAASSGSTGMSQRFCAIQLIRQSSLHRIDLIQIRRFVMPINRDNEGQSDRRLGCGNGNGKNHEHDPAQMLISVVAIPPESDEIKVGGIEHPFDARS